MRLVSRIRVDKCFIGVVSIADSIQKIWTIELGAYVSPTRASVLEGGGPIQWIEKKMRETDTRG
jgi:hypothetical protein